MLEKMLVLFEECRKHSSYHMIASFAIGYIICGQVHTVLANFNTNIAAAEEEAIDLIKIMSCRGVIESVNVIAGCGGGKCREKDV
jgi:hypothetical protein